MKIHLKVALNPDEICTAQQKGCRVIKGRAIHYTKDCVKDSNAKIRSAVETALRDAGFKFRYKQFKANRSNNSKYLLKKVVDNGFPKKKPLEAIIVYKFPFPKTASKKRLEQSWEFMTERPDVDNLTKNLFDALTDLCLIVDDAQIVSAPLIKIRNHSPAIEIIIMDTPTVCLPFIQ